MFHEQVALQWLLGMGNGHTRNMVLKNSWFFFEMMVAYGLTGGVSVGVSMFVCLFMCSDQRHGSAYSSQ